MSEPRASTDSVEVLREGLLHWTVADERIGFRSDAYAVRTPSGLVLVDPLPCRPTVLARPGEVAAICLTGAFHQRSAWRYRRRFGVPVLAPRGARGLDEPPDGWFDDGDEPVAGLLALHRHGPTEPHHVFLWPARQDERSLLCGDLLMRDRRGPFRLVPDEHHQDRAATRRAVTSLVELDPRDLCPAHGAPRVGGGRQAIVEALRRDG